MRQALLVLLALVPSLWYSWQAAGLPHLGHFHDDGVYVGTAESIADGRGPRVYSAPGEPWQTRYPALFPLYLAAGARSNYALQALLWLTLPALLILAARWRPQEPLLLILLGWNAYTVLFTGSALSEMFATVLLLATVLAAERGKPRLAAVLVTLCFLTRTALLVAPAALVLWLLWKRRWRDALWSAAIAAPVLVSWQIFVRLAADPTATGTPLFYLNYVDFYRENVTWPLLPQMLWVNFQFWWAGAAGLLFFNGGESLLEVNFARLLLFGAISGLIRQTRADGLRLYPVLGLLYSLELLVWNYIPQERFLFPLLPLLLTGFLTEMRHFLSMLRKSWQKQRGAAIFLAVLAGTGLLWAIQRNVQATWQFAPSIPVRYRAFLPQREEAYAWIRQNTPAGANFLAYDDPNLHRYTRRHGYGFHFPTRLFYLEDDRAILDYHLNVLPRMRAEKLEYLLIGPNDLEQDINPADRTRIRQQWDALPELETVFENKLYKIRRLRILQSGQ